MDPRLPTHFGQCYKSQSQKARRITESWGADNLYCCACPTDRLHAEKPNAHVNDFLCPECVERYQLKSQRKKLGGRILGSNYQRLIDAIHGNSSPSFFLLHYQLPEWMVRNLIVIPRFAISPSVVIRRKPLSASARRSNWTGYVLDVSQIPPSARILLVVEGKELPRQVVREQYARIAQIQSLKPSQRGWTLDVLRCIESLPEEIFTNDDIYAFAPELSKLYPENRHIREKIRQQLQILRDRGFLKSSHRGTWRRL